MKSRQEWLTRLSMGEIGKQGLLFGAIGVLNTAIHFLIYQVLLAVGVQYIIASSLGYGFGLLNSYILNRRFTFKRTVATKWRGEFLRFILVNLIALGSNLLILQGVVASGILDEKKAVIPAIAGSLVINFLGNKFWTFRGDRSQSKAAEND